MDTKLLFISAVFAQDVSRIGKSLSQVVVISSPGLTFPTTNFGLALNPQEEPVYLGYLTPIGQRQQFLIGSELRERYITEA
jgi:hypothetical protein